MDSKMENFKYKGREVDITYFTGEVVGSDKYSETYVSSSGGGGYVGPNGGHVSAPTVSSTTVTCHEFWLRGEDGTEKSISLRGYDIPLRTGQKVTMVMAGDAKASTGRYTTLVNHSAQRHWTINTVHDVIKNLGLVNFNFMISKQWDGLLLT